MWMTLLLIARASCEWVEISQHHYRQPTKTHHEYANQTMPLHKWSDPNIGVTRIESSRIPNKYGTEIDRKVFIPSVNTGNKEFVGTVERVPSVGIIQRVQLPNTPVKSPTVLETDAGDKLYTNFEISLENDSEELPQRVHKRKQHVDTKTDQFDTQVSEIIFTNYSLLNDDKINRFVTLNMKNTNENVNKLYSKGNINKITPNEYETEAIKIATEATTHQESKKNSKDPNFITSDHTIISGQTLSPNNMKLGHNILKGDDLSIVNVKEGSDKEGNTKETPSINSKTNTMETLIKIMKTVADTISQNSHRSLRNKVRYLHELKNTMLNNIENRIDNLWPDDERDQQNGGKRRSRSAQDAARGHVEFPSSESALMTISFLTFAVFLIKLVLQVIQTYKNKTMMVAPLVVATAGRAAVQRLRSNNKLNN